LNFFVRSQVKAENEIYVSRIAALRTIDFAKSVANKHAAGAVLEVYFPLIGIFVEIPLRLPTASRLFQATTRVNPPELPDKTIRFIMSLDLFMSFLTS
jgi:hypothetical protein